MKLIRPYNLLGYPGGNPGFDPSHFASAKAYLSGVSIGANLINLITGHSGTSSSVGYAIDGVIGPSQSQNSNISYVKFPALIANGVHNNTTLGIIFTAASYAGNLTLLCTSASSGGWQVKIDGATHQLSGGVPGVVDFTPSGFLVSLNVPYFAILAIKASTSVNYCLVNLVTGAVKTSSVSCPAATSTAGDVFSGGDGVAGDSLQAGSIAAVYGSDATLSAQQLLLWAADPWSFWYPRVQQQLIFSSLRAPAGSPVVFRKTLSQIGGRVGTRQPQGWAA